MATIAVTRRHDLTDAQWQRLAALLPAAPAKGRPPKWEKRQLIDGIRWRIRIGSPWRDVPAEYGPWQTLYGLFRRWQRDGTWDKILAAAQATADTQGRITWTISVDSMTSRAHQHAAGARRNGYLQKEPPGGVHDEPADHALGRSRGGLTTKTHLACEQGQKVLSMGVTAGHRGDSPQFIPVLRRIKVTRLGAGRPRTSPDLVLADKAYTSRNNRAYLRKRGIKACIPSKIDQDAHRKAKGSRGGRPPSSTETFTGCDMPSRTASTGSSATAAWPPATTARVCVEVGHSHSLIAAMCTVAS